MGVGNPLTIKSELILLGANNLGGRSSLTVESKCENKRWKCDPGPEVPPPALI